MNGNTTLRDLRLARGLTLRDVADRLHISVPAVSRKERGIRPIRLHEVPILAELYGVPPETVYLCAQKLTAQETRST